MKISEMFLVIVFILALFVVAAIVIPLFNIEPTVSPVMLAVDYMDYMSRYLSAYYEDNSKSERTVQASEVVDILKNNDSRIWSKKPVINYNNEYDFGVFLLLPKELKSELPTIIAYTTPLVSRKKTYRVILILNKTNMNAVFINSYYFEKAIDINDTYVSPKPDFYRCMSPREK